MPQDRFGRTLEVGDTVLYPSATGGAGNKAIVRRGRIARINPEKHHGYGFRTPTLTVWDRDDFVTRTVNIPDNCIKER